MTSTLSCNDLEVIRNRTFDGIAASHAVRKLRKGAHSTTRARAPAIPAGSEA